ncbi:MAG: hypothetical protein JNL57_11230 [Bacteroidetes bacterium]|nr:hypothetical protein [Bacteroidota bacterium]
MDKGFRRRFIALGILSLVTCGIVWVYLHFNQHARSRLTLLVPENAHWFWHFQTRQIEDRRIQGAIPYYDSLATLVPTLGALSPASDRGEYGVDGHSDMLIFANDFGWYALLSVTSEPRLKAYIETKIPKEMLNPVKDEGTYFYTHGRNRNIYLAFKHKALVFYVPSDTVSAGEKALQGLKLIFDPKLKPMIGNTQIQKIYDAGNDVVFWARPNVGFPLTHAVNLSQGMAEFTWYGQAKGSSTPSPLMLFSAAGEKFSASDVSAYLDTKNQMKSSVYLNLTFRTIYHYLIPFRK